MRRAPALPLLLLLASCATFAPEPARSPGPVVAGRPSRIALRVPPPAGEAVSWDAGDGTPPALGPQLMHAWQRPGVYTVRATASGGTAELQVEVRARPVLDAVPAGAKLAAASPAFWRRLGPALATFDRLSVAGELHQGLAELQARLGVDPTRPGDLPGVGIDPDEGVAVVILAEDDDGSWLLIGTLDDDKAMQLGARALQAVGPQEKRVDAGRFAVARTVAGEEVAWGVADGYLALRFPGEAPPGGLEAAFARFALRPEGSLGQDPTFQRGRAHAPGDDLVLFTRTELPEGPLPGVVATAPAVVVGLALRQDELEASVSIPLEPAPAEALARAVKAAGRSPNFLTRVPAGPFAYLSLSLHLGELAAALIEPDKLAALDAVTRERFGVPLHQVLRAFTGNVGGAAYFDAAAFFARTLPVPGAAPAPPPPPVVIVVELAKGPEPRRLAAELLERSGGTRVPGPGERWQVEDALVIVSEGELVIATGGARGMLGRQARRSSIAEAVAPELDREGLSLLFVDLSALAEEIRGARPPEGLPPELQALAAGLAAGQADTLSQLQDLLFTLAPTPEGLAGRVRLRLKPGAARSPLPGG